MFKYLAALAAALILGTTAIASAAPTAQNFNNIQPFTANTYNNGTAALPWLNFFTKYASSTVLSSGTVCIGTDCRAVWPGGASPFSFASTWSAINAATSSNVWVQGVFNASSTAHFSGNVTVGEGTGPGYLTVDYASTTVASAGTFCLTGDTCRTAWPTGTAYPFTPSTLFGIPTSATSTAIEDSTGLFVRGSPVATTSLVVCLQGPPTCQFTDPADAVRALPTTGGTVHIKTGTYTGLKPLVIPTGYDNVIIEGEGVGTVLRWSRFTYPGAYIHSEGTDQKQNIVVRDLQISQFNSEGASTCIDFGRFADSWFTNLEIRNCFVEIMASTSAFQNHFQNIEIHNGTAASSGVSVYGGANDNIFTDVSVANITDTAKGFYFDAHSNKCYLCDVESFASYGLYLGPNADDFIGDMYLELNQTNAYVSEGAESVNLQGTYESASTTAQNIVNGGAIGLRVNAWVQFENLSYFSGDNYMFGTTTALQPSDLLTLYHDSDDFIRMVTLENANQGLKFSAHSPGVTSGSVTKAAIIWQGNNFWKTGDMLFVNNGNIGNSDYSLDTDVRMDIKSTGDIGIASTSPQGLFSIHANTSRFLPTSPASSTALFIIGSSTATATTTLFSISNTGAIDTTLASGCAQADSNGILTSTGVACGSGGGGAYPFTPSTNFSSNVQATTGIPWFQNGLQASSTAQFDVINVASSTATSTFAGGLTGPSSFSILASNGHVGIGTSTPEVNLEVSDPANFTVLKIEGSGGNTIGPLLRLDTPNNVRAMGAVTFDTAGDREWYFGSGGDGSSAGNDNFVVNRRTTASTAFQQDVANYTDSDVANLLMITSTGNVGLGTTTPTFRLNPFSATAPQLALSAGAGISQWTFRNEGGDMAIATTTISGTATSTVDAIKVNGTTGQVFFPSSPVLGVAQTYYACGSAAFGIIWDSTTCLVSSLKYKKDVTPINVGLAELMKLHPVNFYLKNPADTNAAAQQFGFIAEEVEKVDSRLITYETDGTPRSFRYENFTALLAKGIQELFTWNTKQDDKIEALEARIAELEAQK